jgi:hypothetical protein
MLDVRIFLHAIDFDAQWRFNAFQTLEKMALPQNLYIYVARSSGLAVPGGLGGAPAAALAVDGYRMTSPLRIHLT